MNSDHARQNRNAEPQVNPNGRVSGIHRRHVPDLDLMTSFGPDRVARLLRDGRGLLLTTADEAVFEAVFAEAWSARIGRMHVQGELGADAVLVRPDGYVCWAGSAADVSSLADALAQWAGAAVTTRDHHGVPHERRFPSDLTDAQ
ncbi:hypothetical protein ABT294_29135 [Nonomuraea sp. NPDC000554]|uniref:aromatic-ring hydroxylase C-terminal domain-containing protein n=1 Tax=Nonomuraea sp. NPDC000554 TaxID=3154259 RepID=UPI00331F61DD